MASITKAFKRSSFFTISSSSGQSTEIQESKLKKSKKSEDVKEDEELIEKQ